MNVVGSLYRWWKGYPKCPECGSGVVSLTNIVLQQYWCMDCNHYWYQQEGDI